MQTIQHEQFLRQLANTIITAETLEGLTRPLLDLLLAVTKLESTFLTSIDLPQSQQHILFVRNGSAQLAVPESLSLSWVDSMCRRAMEDATPYVTDAQERWSDIPAVHALGIQTYLGTPIRIQSGELYGTLCAASSRAVQIDADTQRILEMFSHLISQQIERQQTLQQLRIANAALETCALQDMLTGLPNRRALMEALQRALAQRARSDGALLLAFIDLDEFKAINDRHGHEVGDRFLGEVSRALIQCLREGDTLARLGGDEFVILAHVEPGDAPAGIQALHARIQSGLCRRFSFGEVAIDYPGASVGIVAAREHDTADSILSRADAVMYEHKQARRSARGNLAA